MDREQKLHRMNVRNNMSSVVGVEMGEEESGDKAPITQIELEPLVRDCSTFLMLTNVDFFSSCQNL